MNAFAEILNGQQIDAIIAYINSESRRLGIPDTYNPHSYFDECYEYSQTYIHLIHKYDSITSTLVGKEVPMTTKIIVEPTDVNPNNDNGTIPIKVSPEVFNAEYYQFKVEAYGWYNIDDLIEDKFNSKESELTVEIKDSKTERFNIYLIIPSLKVFAEGGILDNKKQYGFYTINGKLPLPQDYKAYIFLIGEENGEIYFGKTEFVTSYKQNITVSQRIMNKDDVLAEISTLNASSFGIKISERKEYKDLEMLRQAIFDLEHKLSNCDNCMKVSK